MADLAFLGLGLLEMNHGKKKKSLSILDIKIKLLVAADLREDLDEEMGKVGDCEGIKRDWKILSNPHCIYLCAADLEIFNLIPAAC